MSDAEMRQMAEEMQVEGLFDDSMDHFPPVAVIHAVGKALTPEALLVFWNKKTTGLAWRSPKQVWLEGGWDEVMNYIQAALGRDMV